MFIYKQELLDNKHYGIINIHGKKKVKRLDINRMILKVSQKHP